MPLVTLQEARRFCGKAIGDGVDDQTIADVVAAVSQFAEGMVRRPLSKVTRTGKILDGDGSDTLFLEYPLISVAALNVDAARMFQSTTDLLPLNTSDGTGAYIVDLEAGMVTLVDGSIFPDARAVVKVTYEAGYETAVGASTPSYPPNIRTGILRLVRKIFGEVSGDIAELVTGATESETVGDVSGTFSTVATKVLAADGVFDAETREIINLHFAPYSDARIAGLRRAAE